MKTTLNLNDELIASAKVMAVRSHTSLTKLIEEGLRLRIAAGAQSPSTKRKIPIFKGGGGLRKGVNALSNKSMLEAAES